MSNTNQQNMITQGTTLVGDIFSEGDFRVEGNITVSYTHLTLPTKRIV